MSGTPDTVTAFFDSPSNSNVSESRRRPLPESASLSQPSQAFGSTLKKYTRHPSLCFEDGNIAILAGKYYFMLYSGVLWGTCSGLQDTIQNLCVSSDIAMLEGRPALVLDDSPEDFVSFLLALSGGLNEEDFDELSASLRLATKYGAQQLRESIIHSLSRHFPTSLAAWDLREQLIRNGTGCNIHPLIMINLARQVNAPTLLPSAFYDLSRSRPSYIVAGYYDFVTRIAHDLSDADLQLVFQGKDKVSHSLALFIRDHLLAPGSVVGCNTPTRCGQTLQNVGFELMRDFGGFLRQRSNDPLFAMLNMTNMLADECRKGMRICDRCVHNLDQAVDSSRLALWEILPNWFLGATLDGWGA